jgi:hypothetical protein
MALCLNALLGGPHVLCYVVMIIVMSRVQANEFREEKPNHTPCISPLHRHILEDGFRPYSRREFLCLFPQTQVVCQPQFQSNQLTLQQCSSLL